MVLTKQYLRYIPAGNFNIIASRNSNIVFVPLEKQEGRYVAVGACENIIIWDLRLSEKKQTLPGENAAVTCLAASPDKKHLAAGYADGTIQIFNLKSWELVTILSGHRSTVICLAFDKYGHRLASGSQDTDIIVWDVVAEAGICRLSGHTNIVNKLIFMQNQNVLISCSKDTLVKFWDIDTQHCFKTLTGHHTEVVSLCLAKEDKYLITGSCDAELRVWKIVIAEPEIDNKDFIKDLATSLEITALDDNEGSKHSVQCQKVGTVLRAGNGKVISMSADSTGQVVACHGTDRQIEVFYIQSDTDAMKRKSKRKRKEKELVEKNKQQEDLLVVVGKSKATDNNNATGDKAAPSNDSSEEENQIIGGDSIETDVKVEEVEQELTSFALIDEIFRMQPIRLEEKPKAVHLVLGQNGELRISVLLRNNSLELYTLNTQKKTLPSQLLRSIMVQGHRGEVRALCFSSDNMAIVSGSADSIKMWNRQSLFGLRTVQTESVVSAIFAPGDRYIIIGYKNGKIAIIDIAVGEVVEEIPAHTSEVWSLCLEPNMNGCASGGDKTVKFWQFELVTDARPGGVTKVLSLLHTRTLEVEDTVLCVRLSSNQKFVAVALLDCNVKIFFKDSFKFYLSLYGHKLPVLCMDISSDSTLLVTGSADRNVKIWGMDFGDCHKNIFAHDDTVTGLQFVPKTHYFFTCGKDGKIKQWDADKFVKIVTLQGHVGEAWNLAVSTSGVHIVSCGADNVIRLYERSEEPLVLEDEEETEREREEREEIAKTEPSTVPGQPGIKLPSKRTIGSERGAESIIECLEVCREFKEHLKEHQQRLMADTKDNTPDVELPILMKAFNVKTIDDFIMETIRRIRPSDLEESLVLLPFTLVCEFLKYLPDIAKRGIQIELIVKLTIFLINIHHSAIVANQALVPTMKKLRKILTVKSEVYRDTIGYNYYGMQFLKRELENSEGVQFFREAISKKRDRMAKRKRKEVIERSMLVLTN